MQVTPGSKTLWQQFIDAGLDNFLNRIWDGIWLMAGAVVVAMAVLVWRVAKGRGNAWTYAGVGSAATLFVVLVALVLIAMVPDKRLALALAAVSFALIPVSFVAIDKFAKEPQINQVGLTKAAILAHYYVQTHQLYLKATNNNATPEDYAWINDQINELRKELSSVKMSRAISTDTAALMVAPAFSQTDPQDFALRNSSQLMGRLHQKWKAWYGPQQLMQ